MPSSRDEVAEWEPRRLIVLLHHRDHIVQQQNAAQAAVAVTDLFVAIPVDALADIRVKDCCETVFLTVHICVEQVPHAHAAGVEQIAGKVVIAFVAVPFAQSEERVVHLPPELIDECPLVVAAPLVVVKAALEVAVSKIVIIPLAVSLASHYVKDVTDARPLPVLPPVDESPESIVGQRLFHHVPLRRNLKLPQADCLAVAAAGEV